MYYFAHILKNALLKRATKEHERDKIKDLLEQKKIFNYLIDNNHKIYYKNNNFVVNSKIIYKYLESNNIFLKIDNKPLFDIKDIKICNLKDFIEFMSFLNTKKNKTIKDNNKQKKSLSLVNFENLMDSNFLIFDVEFYEKNQKLILEVGFLFHNKNKHIIKHYIIDNNLHIENKDFVPNNKMKFNYGESKITSLKEAIDDLKKYIILSNNIVGHNISSDIKILKLSEFCENKNIINTNIVTKIILNSKDQLGIKRCLDYFNIEYKDLHNAGNDVFYNYIILQKLIDFQKNKKNIKCSIS